MAIMADDLPPEDPGAGSADGDDLLPGLGGNISWCWDFDFAALLDAVTGPAPWPSVPPGPRFERLPMQPVHK